MKERPILFSGPMVRAIVEGRKTQTRRIIRPQPTFEACTGDWLWKGMRYEWRSRCPYGQPSDRLWVRETWAQVCSNDGHPDCGEHLFSTEYRADSRNPYPGRWPPEMATDSACGRWKSPIHMPRWASRINLDITRIRVQHLQAITALDCLAEGITDNDDPRIHHNIVALYHALWDSLNAKRGFGWAANPWVWVIEFKRIRESPA